MPQNSVSQPNNDDQSVFVASQGVQTLRVVAAVLGVASLLYIGLGRYSGTTVGSLPWLAVLLMLVVLVFLQFGRFRTALLVLLWCGVALALFGGVRRSGFELVGRDGLTLSEAWEDGMESLHGIHVHGFPNAFIVGINQGANLISNVPHNLVEAARTVAAVVRRAADLEAASVEVSAEAQQAWIDQLLSAGPPIFGGEQCTPGYYNNEGGPIGRKQRLFASGYPAGPIPYFDYIERWRSSGEFFGLVFS